MATDYRYYDEEAVQKKAEDGIIALMLSGVDELFSKIQKACDDE